MLESERCGIIFIDCWQDLQDQGQWLDLDPDWNFYQNMVTRLAVYRPDSLVFHTGDYGGLPLARDLECLHRQSNAVDILKLQSFEQHYTDKQIFNWIVVGGHWQICTHQKPLGFYNLLDVKKLDARLRIYSHMDCTLRRANNDMDHPIKTTCKPVDYQNDGLTWQVNGMIAELTGPL